MNGVFRIALSRTAAVAALALVAVGVAGAAVSSSPVATPPFDDQWDDAANFPDVNSVAISGTTGYASGRFTYAGGTLTGSFAALNRLSGAAKASPDFEGGNVYASAPDGAGGWFVGGSFTAVDGVPRPGLAHIRADNTLDPGFAPTMESGLVNPPSVTALAVQNGAVYVAGQILYADGEVRDDSAAFDTGSGAVLAWNPGLDDRVTALVATPSQIFVTGNLSYANNHSIPHTGVLAVSPSTGQLTAWNAGITGEVDAATLAGSILYVGGSFTSVNGGAPRYGLAALSISTGHATSWAPRVGGTGFDVRSIAVGPSAVYAGGTFTSAGTGSARSSLAAFDRTSGSPTTWAPKLALQGDKPLVAAVKVSGSSVIFAGRFDSVGGKPRRNAAAVDVSSGAPTAFAPAIDGVVRTLGITSASAFVGGDFDTAGGSPRPGLAKFDLTTGQLSSWAPSVGGDGRAHLVAISGSTVFVATGSDVEAIDMATGARKWSVPVVGEIDALATGGSSLYIGGVFSQVAGVARHYLAGVSLSSGALRSWNPYPSGVVYALSATATTVYAGGQFTKVNGTVARQNLAAFDAATGKATAWHAQSSVTVLAIAVANGRVFAGGNGAVNAFDAATGNTLSSWNTGLSTPLVDAIAVSGTVVYLGGRFAASDGPRNLLAVDFTSGARTAWTPDPDDRVVSLAVSPSYVVAGGAFNSVSGVARGRLAAWTTG